MLVAATTMAGCSSCAKDEAQPTPVPADTTPTPVGERKVVPLPRGFERRPPAAIQNGASVVPVQLVDDAGRDATTN